MGDNPSASLDVTDEKILELLQQDGRLSTAELAREISMSASAAADRVRRLTDLGVIRGYRAIVDADALGYPVTAFVRLRLATAAGRTFFDLLEATPQILAAHHITGEDCYLLKVVARSMADLEDIAGKLVTFGQIITNVVFRSAIDDRPLPTNTASSPA